MTGQTVSHYVVREKLAEGGSSVVYRAEDVVLRREVVLKFLPAEKCDAGSLARFDHEARTVSSLNHPNICTIYEIGEHHETRFLAMEWLDGETLSQSINGSPMDAYRAVELAVQIADGLEAAHAEGIVHRDVKPGNIFVTRQDRIKLLDFGLAVLLPRRPLTKSAMLAGMKSSTAGTIPYMSPEQARAEALDHRTDLFSFGAVLYEMTTGRRPFSGAMPAEVVDAIVRCAPVPVRDLASSVPAELQRIIDKALEKNVRLRYQTAADMRADLQRLKRDLDSVRPALNNSPRRTTRRSAHRIANRFVAVIVAGAPLIGVGVFVANRWRQQMPTSPGVVTRNEAPAADKPIRNVTAVAPAASPPPPEFRKRDLGGASPTRPPRHRPEATPAMPTDPPAAPAVAVESPPSTPSAPSTVKPGALQLARKQIDLKLYEPAVESLRRIIEGGAAADAVEALFLTASIHEVRGNQDTATASYLEIANRYGDDPRAPEALVKMAQSILKSKRADNESDARRILTDVTRRYPNSAWAAEALLLRGQLEERRALWERDPQLGTSVPSALITYRDAVQRYGSSGPGIASLDKLARVYVETKRYDLAAQALVTLAERDHENRYDSWFRAGEIYEKRLKQVVQARQAYSRVPPESLRYAEAQKRMRK